METETEIINKVETPREQVLSIIRELDPQDQVDLVNSIYETIFSDLRNLQQKLILEHKKIDEVMLSFRFKPTIS